MGSRRSNPHKDPQTPAALRWLRHEARLTQSEVAERVREAGHSLSDVYYRQCESDSVAKYPSEETLGAILEALGSGSEDFEQLLAAPPWQETSLHYDTNVRMRKDSPSKPSSSYNTVRARSGLQSPIDGPFPHQLGSVRNALDMHADSVHGQSGISEATSQALFASFSTTSPLGGTADPIPHPVSEAELLEVRERYRRAPQGTQLTVLGLLRDVDRNS